MAKMISVSGLRANFRSQNDYLTGSVSVSVSVQFSELPLGLL